MLHLPFSLFEVPMHQVACVISPNYNEMHFIVFLQVGETRQTARTVTTFLCQTDYILCIRIQSDSDA